MTTTVVEVAAADPPVIMGVLVPSAAEERIRRLVRQTQASMSDVIASWLDSAEGEDPPVPEGAGAGLSASVPASVAASVRAEAQRRGLQVAQVAAARLASVAARGA